MAKFSENRRISDLINMSCKVVTFLLIRHRNCSRKSDLNDETVVSGHIRYQPRVKLPLQ